MRSTCRALVTAAVVTLLLASLTAPAGAQAPAYASWSVAGAANSFTGTMAIGVPGFPSATFTSDATAATGVQVESGASTWLPASTPFGAVFGSSQDQPYASIRYAAGSTPSTTTFTFNSPTPASGWGFTLGDIDADSVQIQATGASGAAVPVSALGFEGTFNYASPAGDVPTWDPTTATLTGNVADTTGASGWFRPTVALSSLTFVFTVQAGLPIYQVWFAGDGTQPPATTTTTSAPATTAPTTTVPPAATTTTTCPPTSAAGARSGAPLHLVG